VETTTLRAAMEKHGVVVLVGQAASADNASAAGRQYFRISFNLDDMALLAEGVRRLGAMLRAFRRD
jgi:DNA-binding transcriptional MocR family regulator